MKHWSYEAKKLRNEEEVEEPLMKKLKRQPPLREDLFMYQGKTRRPALKKFDLHRLINNKK